MAYKFRLHIKAGTIHHLDCGCKIGKNIADGNFKDFYTCNEAEMEAKHLGLDVRKCKRCKW